jgi:hypothetical protein
MSYAVQVSVQAPSRYERLQVVLRLVLLLGFGWLGVTAGLIVTLLYFGLPTIAAIAISTHDGEWYEAQVAPKLWRSLSWLFGFTAYMLFLTDRFPVEAEAEADVKTTVIPARPWCHPTLGTALGRLLKSLPSLFVLALLAVVSSVLWLASVATVLIDRKVPAGIQHFQEGFLRWAVRLAAYHASLVDDYPPFSFEHEELTTALEASPGGDR